MVKNLPLLLAMLVIGCSTTTIPLTTNSPQFVEWFLLIAGIILNIWSMMGLILHLGIKRLSNN
ncbi:hypothetical protein PB1_02535 [Bacillus methanolicus PB1]|uniref:Lipoprotein n=1 Tax=Bacillus methanolicus PB1 TaxID=997296 RepID=I3E5K9_BACMT|nr:hypothetical protein PB1_02535 [Bacillus methanolicus PB1]